VETNGELLEHPEAVSVDRAFGDSLDVDSNEGPLANVRIRRDERATHVEHVVVAEEMSKQLAPDRTHWEKHSA